MCFSRTGFSFLLFEGRMAKLATGWERFAGRRPDEFTRRHQPIGS